MNDPSDKVFIQDSLSFLTKKKANLVKRYQAEQFLRSWFQTQDFVEVTSPTLLRYSSLEKNIYPLSLTIRDHNQKIYPAYLRVSPELSLKKILATGLPKIFELGPCFRDQEDFSSTEHGVEFTLLEWYQFNCTLEKMMDKVQELILFLAKKICGNTTVVYQNKKFDLNAPWYIISVAQAFKKYAGINFNTFESWEDLLVIARQYGFRSNDIDDSFYWIFLNKVEPHLRQGPTILYEYPIFQASFSKAITKPTHNKKNLAYGLRFEVYLGGMEIANAFEELIDAKEQERRWLDYLEKNSVEKNTQKERMDLNFLAALNNLQNQIGKYESIAGIALGWERLLMFFFNEKNISAVNPLRNF